MEEYQDHSLGSRVFQKIRDNILNGTYKENDQILKPDGCINMNKGSAFAQMRLRSWRNSLYKMQIDDFICTAIRDKL